MPPTIDTIETESQPTVRNEASPWVDTQLVARLRRPPGGYELIRGILGRGVSVRRKDNWRSAGFAMVLAGIAIVVWTNVQEPDVEGIGRMLVIVGAVIAAYAKLKVRTGSTHEAFLTGLDRGREDGFQEGFREGSKAKAPRPVLVNLADRLERERQRERTGN